MSLTGATSDEDEPPPAIAVSASDAALGLAEEQEGIRLLAAKEPDAALERLRHATASLGPGDSSAAWLAMGNCYLAQHARALANVLPMMEMRNSKAGQGMVPFPLAPRRAEGIAMKWLVGAARKRKANGNMDDRLSNELLQAYQNKGTAVGKREATHKSALANQAGAHFRWRGGAKEPGAVNMDSRKTFRPGGRRSVKKLQRAFKRRA